MHPIQVLQVIRLVVAVPNYAKIFESESAVLVLGPSRRVLYHQKALFEPVCIVLRAKWCSETWSKLTWHPNPLQATKGSHTASTAFSANRSPHLHSYIQSIELPIVQFWLLAPVFNKIQEHPTLGWRDSVIALIGMSREGLVQEPARHLTIEIMLWWHSVALFTVQCVCDGAIQLTSILRNYNSVEIPWGIKNAVATHQLVLETLSRHLWSRSSLRDHYCVTPAHKILTVWIIQMQVFLRSRHTCCLYDKIAGVMQILTFGQFLLVSCFSILLRRVICVVPSPISSCRWLAHTER